MMYNFIIVDDNDYFRNQIFKIVDKVVKDNNYRCNIFMFNEYNEEFFDKVYQNLENKVYLMDIETPLNNGIDVARTIRTVDLVGIIIFVSAYEVEYSRAILKSDSRYLCSISKKELDIVLKEKIKSVFTMKTIKTIKMVVEGRLYHIAEDNILYIKYENRKCAIKTSNNSIITNKGLNDIYKLLSENFVYSHQACIVNMNKVVEYSLITKEIIFNNYTKIDLISRKYITNLDNFYKSK